MVKEKGSRKAKEDEEKKQNLTNREGKDIVFNLCNWLLR
jgi:hypothetical protein